VAINSLTGDITLTPMPGNIVTAVMCVVVEEYRNGVLIGQVVRDMQLTVIDCSIFGTPNSPPFVDSLTNVVGGYVNGPFNITACAFDNLCFDIPSNDPNINQNWSLYWNQNIPGATFVDPTNPALTDSLFGMVPQTAQFCWQPQAPGLYTFLITVVDDGCPIIGLNQYTVVINVIPCSLNPSITTNLVGCFDVQFTGNPGGGLPPFSFQWSGNGGLSSNPNATGGTFVHTYPGPGSYNYQVIIGDGTGLIDTAYGSITLTNTASADAGPDLSLCPLVVGNIGTAALPNHTYQWNSIPPNTGFQGPKNIPQPNVTLNNLTNSPIVVQYIVTATDATGCQDKDTVLVVFNNKPLSLFAVSSPICVGDLSTVVYAGNQTPGAIYHWDWGTANVQGTGTGPGPHQVSYNSGGSFDISLWVEIGGCASDTSTRSITVFEVPTSNFIASSPVCVGQTSNITYAGTATPAANYLWDFDGGTIVTGSGVGPYTVTWSTSGIKNITLTVEENGCVSLPSSQQVTVYPIPTATFSAPSSVCEGDPAQIVYNGSASSTANYSWDFGSGAQSTGTGQGPYTVTWLTPGQKTVCLQVEENGCTSQALCKTVTVTAKPVATIAPVTNQCLAGNSFNFTNTGTPGVTASYWTFGADAVPATSSAANPTGITYINPGIKTVTLYVVKNGCVSDITTISFEVYPDPSANFQVNTGAVCSGDCFTFTYLGTPYTGQTYSWNFGPNAIPTSSSLQNPGCITFTSGGAQTVTLIVNYNGCVAARAQQITVNPAPIVNAGPDVSFCEGGGGAQLNATVTGGTMPYTYQWTCNVPNCGLSNPFTEDPFANPTDTTTYYLQVTDGNGCMSNIDSVVVFVKPKPVADAGPDIFICEEGFGDFLQGGLHTSNIAPGPFTYQWSPCDGMLPPNCVLPNAYVRPDTTTIYTFVITDLSTGCTSQSTTLDTLSTMTVHVKPLPRVEAGRDTIICLGETVQLQGFADNAGPGYTYIWTPNDPSTNINDPTLASPTVSPDFTTTFFLVATSNGCDSPADSVTVTVLTLPTTSGGPRRDICLGDSVLLNGLGSGDPTGTLYTYLWTPSIGLSDPTSATPMASPPSTQTYYLQAGTDRCFGFVDTIEVQVKSTPIAQILSPDTILCHGDSITLSSTHSFTTTPPASPVLYSWAPNDGSLIQGIDSPTPTIFANQTMIYTLTVTAAGDCPTTDEIKIEVLPDVLAELTADTNVICAGDETQLHAMGGVGSASYLWSPFDGLSDPTIAEPFAGPMTTTTYTVLVQEGKCSDMDSITIMVHPKPDADFYTSQLSGCAELEVSFLDNTTDALSLIWDFGDGTVITNEANPSHIYSTPGTYVAQLTAVGVGGCRSVSDGKQIVVSDNSFAAFSSSPEATTPVSLPWARFQFEDLSQNGISWTWDFGDGYTSGEQHPAHTYLEAGEYDVTLSVMNEDGCISTLAYGPYIVYAPVLDIPNVFTPNGDGINDFFNVIYNGKEDYSLKVFDRWGKTYFEAFSPEDQWSGFSSSESEAPEGVYFYTLQIGERSYTGNLTLMR
jgi:gliding motility-associated-like protein